MALLCNWLPSVNQPWLTQFKIKQLSSANFTEVAMSISRKVSRESLGKLGLSFHSEMCRIATIPHLVQHTVCPYGSAIDGRTTRHEGYAQSINALRAIETVFAGSSSVVA